MEKRVKGHFIDGEIQQSIQKGKNGEKSSNILCRLFFFAQKIIWHLRDPVIKLEVRLLGSLLISWN
jgi:hypothetical protein